MMNSFGYLLAAAAIVVLPATAQAQKLVAKQIVLQEFGDCLVKIAPAKSQRLLLTEFGSAAEQKIAVEISMAGSACLRGRPGLTMQIGAVRGAIAEAHLRRAPNLFERGAMLAPVAPVRPAKADGRAFVIAYSGCLTTSAPQQSVALLQTPLASPDERAAFLKYGDTLSACMPLDQRYTIDITDLRNHIAAIVYLKAFDQLGAVGGAMTATAA